MYVIRRFTRSLNIGIKTLLDEVENHEAGVAAVIREVEAGHVRIRSERLRCERRVTALRDELERLSAEVERWGERAQRFRDERPKALECVRRLRAARGALEVTRARLREQEQLLAELVADDQAVLDKLSELRRRRTSLAARDARSSACAAAQGACHDDVEELFDRWQARVEQREARTGLETPVARDAFARELDDAEDEAELEAELERVLTGEVHRDER